MIVERSEHCVLLAHCILAQTVRADGCEKVPAAVRRVVEFCLDNDLNMIQMPCPETRFCGLPREPHGKKWYEQQGLRKICRIIAAEQAVYARQLVDAGKIILAIIGVEFSPACSTVKNNNSVYRQHGIYMEELEVALEIRGLCIPAISINPDWRNRLERDLADILEKDQPNANT